MLLALSALSVSCVVGIPGPVSSRYEAKAGAIGIRIVQRPEVGICIPVGDTFFRVESRPRGERRWRKVLAFREDDAIEVRRDAATILSDDIAFVFFGGHYLVTTDGGHQWSAWDAERDLPDWIRLNFAPIESVTLGIDGKGTMRMALLEPTFCGRDFITTDFGRTWTRPQ